jgi:membrane protease YdiL (CAAX protease family)
MKRVFMQKLGSFYFLVAFEISAGVLAILLSRFLGYDLFKNVNVSISALMKGFIYAVPALIFFYVFYKIPLDNIKGIEDIIINFLNTVLTGCGVVHFAIISICAGVCEELLFRGFLQGFLTEKFGIIIGIIVANIAFGLMHPVSFLYAFMTFFVGCYFSLLLHLTNNLFVLMVTHAAYDFIALCYVKYVKLK